MILALSLHSLSFLKMQATSQYDVIVIGGGHAGTEAALASARLGAKTLLITQNIETLGQMSCNPAIGGIGKGHLVKEIDALGGLMGAAIDRAGIQFRILNASKGAAVRASRAQADRQLYKKVVRKELENKENLSLLQQTVADLIVQGDRVRGVVTEMGVQFTSQCVVLTVGTFLAGRIHIGLNNYSGGRAGEPPSNALAERLRQLPFRVNRLKTGTPPRIDSRSIDFSVMEKQWGDTPLPFFSFLDYGKDHPRQLPCHITRTNSRTHEIIRAGLDRSPMYTGVIEGIGPRYCPSIEDKIVRFADKDSHQIFVEPEGLDCNEIYPNGISTSLPYDVQLELVRSIAGFEHAHITRPGYAIEYDFFDPRDLKASLETKHLNNLFFAGQINGTTGYEEAAAQGLIAGLNAGLKAQEKEAWSPGRELAYMGVMIDDLITQGTSEPYRMFTSRAEYRLLLREDNADLRLTEKGRELGLVDDVRWQTFENKKNTIASLQAEMAVTRIKADSPEALRINEILKAPLSRDASLMELVSRPEVSIDQLMFLLNDADELEPQALQQVEIQAKYAGYIERQQTEIDRASRYDHWRLSESIDYTQVIGLSNEVREKLRKQKPETLGQASRIPGVTPAAVSLLLVHLKKCMN